MTPAQSKEIDILREALGTLTGGFDHLPGNGSPFDEQAVAGVLQELARRMQDNYPYHHPLYAGQMMKPPHPVARLAYALSLWLNPNNHAIDGGRASSAMEKEAVGNIGRMFGMDEPLGHLCGGGTMANLEALWVAGRLRRGGRVAASEQAHYTHARISEVLNLEFTPVPADADGRMDVGALRTLLQAGDVGTVVATLGTTGLGAVDPLADILDLRREFDFRVHVDAAYGGYFHLASELEPTAARHYARIAEADSVVVDPHKHGLQPYGCGCVLFGDPAVGQLYRHDSPYTYFSSAELHLGEISLECSRPGAAAAALWATQKLMPLVRGGDFSRALDHSLLAARGLHRRLDASAEFSPLMHPELDIVVFALAAKNAEMASVRARKTFEAAAGGDLHLALIDLPTEQVCRFQPALAPDSPTVTCLRSCLMKPEHLDWLDEIWSRLAAAGAAAGRD